MDASYKLKKFFIKTAQTMKKLKQEENQKIQTKLQIIKEIEEELFYMKETAKKMFREQKIQQTTYDNLKEKLKQINQEIKKIKSNLINP